MRTLLIALLLTAPAAFADTTLVYHDGDGQLSYQIRISKDGVRFDHRETGDGVMLFDLKSKRMIVLDPEEREYMEFDEATIASMRAQIEQAKQMAAQMGLDLSQLGIDDSPDPVEVDTGEKKTVNGFKCTVYRIEIGDLHESTACIGKASDLGMPASDWNALLGMYEVIMNMSSDMLGMDMDYTPTDGIPVESMDADGDNFEVLVKVDNAKIDPSVFAIPSGYKKMSLDFMGR